MGDCFVFQRVTSPDAVFSNAGNSRDTMRMDGRNEETQRSTSQEKITQDADFDCEETSSDSCLPLQRGQQNGNLNAEHAEHAEHADPEALPPKQHDYYKCYVHDEVVKVFCQDCKMAVCHVCCSINHRGCQTVTSLQDALGTLTTSVVKRKGESLEKVSSTKTLIATRKEYIKQVSENTDKVREDVKRAIEDAMEMLKTKEDALLKELDEFERHQTQQLIDENSVDDVIIRQMETEIDAIDRAVESTNTRGICQMYERLESTPVTEVPGCGKGDNSSSPEVLINAKRPNRVGLTWTPGDAEAAVAGRTFGATYTVEAGDVGRETTPLLQKEIRVATPQDETDPDVADVVVMVTGGRKKILVTDVRNGSIKSFNTDGSLECVSEQKMETGPFGITCDENNELLVTFVQEDVVAKFSANPINFLETVTKGRSYQGLARTRVGDIIACRYPFLGKSSIEVIDSAGKILRKHDIGYNRFPIFVCETLDGGCLATDNRAKSLLCISPGGKVTQLYRPKGDLALVNPRAAAVTKTGDILLADFGAHKIIHLTSDGEFIRDILTLKDGISRPRSIVLDDEGLLYVTCGSCVKVFTFE